jgi:hypothetical protein
MGRPKMDHDKLMEMYNDGEETWRIAGYFWINTKQVESIIRAITTYGSVSKANSIKINKKRLMCINVLGGKCSRCGFSDIRALQIDHVNGGGQKEIKKIGSYKMYQNIIENEDVRKNYQILCANCNWIKRYENKENRNGVRNFDYDNINAGGENNDN